MNLLLSSVMRTWDLPPFRSVFRLLLPTSVKLLAFYHCLRLFRCLPCLPPFWVRFRSSPFLSLRRWPSTGRSIASAFRTELFSFQEVSFFPFFFSTPSSASDNPPVSYVPTAFFTLRIAFPIRSAYFHVYTPFPLPSMNRRTQNCRSNLGIPHLVKNH